MCLFMLAYEKWPGPTYAASRNSGAVCPLLSPCGKATAPDFALHIQPVCELSLVHDWRRDSR